MRTETAGMPLEKLKTLTGDLPYSLSNGCQQTLDWLQDNQLSRTF